MKRREFIQAGLATAVLPAVLRDDDPRTRFDVVWSADDAVVVTHAVAYSESKCALPLRSYALTDVYYPVNEWAIRG